MSTHIIPKEQHRALIIALAERLGFDPENVLDLHAETNGSGTVKIEWTEIRIMPEAEFGEMFNAAGRTGESDD